MIRTTLAAIATLLTIGVAAVPCVADSLTMGAVLPQYAIVSVGSNASLTVNSGPITGKVLIGDGSTTSSSGGNNGQVTAGVYVSGTESGDSLVHIATAPTVTTIAASIGQQAYTDAVTLSNYAKNLTVTQTFASINSTQTITGNGGLNVINIGSLQNPLLTIKGTASDTFVINVSGVFNTNQVMTLNGVTASQILWNFTGTSGNIFSTSGGDQLYGTFLATSGGDFQFSNLNLSGELINTDGHIQFVSGSDMSASPFTPPVPEPATMVLLGTGLAGLIGTRRRNRNR